MIEYKDISSDCYSDDGKTLREVRDTSPNLRISAKCEIIKFTCFRELNSLEYFTFEENPNLTIIDGESFYLCKNLKIINLSICNKLIKISSLSFQWCYNVAEVILPKGLLEIQNFAFFGIDYIKNVIIPASVNIIGNSAFCACIRLEKVIFEEGSNLTCLEHGVFELTNITSFRIPEKVSNVNGYAFDDSKLTNLTIEDKNKHLIVVNNSVLSANKSILFFYLQQIQSI